MKQQQLIFVFLGLLIWVSGHSQIVNDGVLQIQPSSVVYFENQYTNTISGTHNCNGNLFLNDSFINNGITSANSGTTSFKSATNALTTISGSVPSLNVYNLEIDITTVAKKGVSVSDNFVLIVNNAVSLLSGDLRLVGEAQLVQTHTGTNINSSVLGKLVKDQQGITSAYGYNFYSSPVNNNTGAFTLNGGMFDGTDSSLNPFTGQPVSFNSGSPYNGLPSVVDGSNNVITALKINAHWLYKYAPNTTGYAGWVKIDQNTLLNPGEGFTMKGTNTLSANQNYVFKGVPNDGDYTFIIASGQSALLGNPYPSSLDANKFINDNLSILDKIQYWVDGGSASHYLSDYLGGYSIYNLTGGVAPSVIPSIFGMGSASGIIPKRYVAVGQGFFVEATANGTIRLDNSQRAFKTENGIDSNFYKSSNKKNNESSKSTIANSYIRIGYEDPETFHRQLLLGFLPEAPANLSLNPGYDAFITEPREDELFYIIDNNQTKKYVIQGVGAFDNLYAFPLGLKITQAGTHTIMLDAVENFSDPVYIKDTVLNITHNLSESNFNPNLPPGDYLDRFQIVFQPATLHVDVLNKNNLTVYYSENNGIIINNSNKIKLNNVLIFNLLGQKTTQLNQNLLNASKIVIPFNYSDGLYFVIIETEQGKETYKILKH